ncbi:hypothetical protein ACKWTF_016522 [Chironomus riparius]
MKFFLTLELCLILGVYVVDVIAGGPSFETSPSSMVEPKTVPCSYFCLNPFKKLYPTSNYKPTFNGCGSGGLTISMNKLPKPEIENCCNDHDICYDTCKKDKVNCDNVFRNCMIRACGSSMDCFLVAESLYQAVDNLGCPAYISAQSSACTCKYIWG